VLGCSRTEKERRDNLEKKTVATTPVFHVPQDEYKNNHAGKIQ
jgi:hypothetical protein